MTDRQTDRIEIACTVLCIAMRELSKTILFSIDMILMPFLRSLLYWGMHFKKYANNSQPCNEVTVHR